MVRKSKGRQKIEMVKMKNESNLQVTFSKRRSGLFKKASELCTLCNAEIAIVVFSPGQKVYSFGHPNVENVVDRFLNINPLPHHQYNNMQLQHNETHQNSIVQHLNDHLTKVVNQLEAEKKKNENLKQIRKNNKRSENWWEKPIEELNLNQVLQLKTTLENLKNKVRVEASKLLQTTVNVPHQNFYTGSSSNGGFRNGADLELFNQRRITTTNANANTNANAFSYNHNIIVPNVTEDFVQDYNMRYRLEYEQEQNQNQGFKKENISEYEQHPHLPFGHVYY